MHYLLVLVVVSVVCSVVVPLPSAVGGVVDFFVSVVFVVSVVLPSLVCEVFVSVLFSVVLLLSQPIVNALSAAIIRNANNRFIFKTLLKKFGFASSSTGTIPAADASHDALSALPHGEDALRSHGGRFRFRDIMVDPNSRRLDFRVVLGVQSRLL
jgi:hypothetical protein